MSGERLKGSMLLVIVLAFVVCIAFYIYSQKEKTVVINKFNDYDGDEYEGTLNYIGDKGAAENYKGKYPGYVKKNTLFKAIEQANLLKYEFNAEGTKTLIKTDRFLRKGAQVKVLNDSLVNPVSAYGHSFVETMSGLFVRLDKLTIV